MTTGNGILYSSGSDLCVRSWQLDTLEEIGSVEVSFLRIRERILGRILGSERWDKRESLEQETERILLLAIILAAKTFGHFF